MEKLNIASPIDLDDVNVIPHLLKVEDMSVNAISFIPHESKRMNDFSAIFTHGYTSHKSSIISWASRLSEFGVPVTIFDLPGHYLGSFNDFKDFETFKNHAHEFFNQALIFQTEQSKDSPSQIIFGGHSLGALLSLKASMNTPKVTSTILVGFGKNDKIKTHFFATPFFKKTLNVRKQLVSDNLSPDLVFSWIAEEKDNIMIKNQKICLIAGEDDVVIGPNGTENLKKVLDKFNEVVLIKPKKLPHNQPELASTHIFNYLKSEFNWSRS